MDVTVVGAGVVGLTSARRLREAGHRVRVLARERPEETVSAVAAAIWFPFAVGAVERVGPWSTRSLGALAQLADRPGTGVRMATGTWLARGTSRDEALCASIPGARRLARSELPDGYRAGFELRLPVCEMPTYLDWLGGDVEEVELAALEDAPGDLVVHCAGLGARELARDTDVHPIRGQVVKTARGRCERFWIADDAPGGLAYVVPRPGLDDVVLGGTAEVGESSLEPDSVEAEAIVRRCRALEQAVPPDARRRVEVGLRPGRSAVRLERTSLGDGRPVVHNYGHGGSGVTLSWGCADEVARLVY